MKNCYICQTKKYLIEFYKSSSKKSGFRDECKSCSKEQTTKYQKKNPDKRKKYQQTVYLNNQTHYLSQSIQWAKTNPDKANARNMRYITRKLQACPTWLTTDQHYQILSFYKLAHEKTQETGIKHEVDHIIPLNGKLVCGLHVPGNLQVITKTANIKKRNHL